MGGRVEVDYNHLAEKDLGTGVTSRTTVVPFVADAIWNIPGLTQTTFSPYLLGGIGLYRITDTFACTGAFVCNISASDTEVGLNGGIGANLFRLNDRTFFFVEARVAALKNAHLASAFLSIRYVLP